MALKYIRAGLFLYGLLNALLYCSLLPLWEGFDEEFHYGYVQYLGAHHRFPVLGHTALSQEINRTIAQLPMSYIMIRNAQMKGVVTFDQYFALDPPVRHARWEQAHTVPTDLRLSESEEFATNYEVHHAPLAYLLMAVPDTVLSSVPLPWRVWIVRIFAAVACLLLMIPAMWALGAETGLDERLVAVLIFLVFSCQMFWATVAHIANDWLAVPLAVWLLVWALRYHRAPSLGAAIWLAVVMGLGLLSKAYFLVFVPLYGLAALAWLVRRKLPMRRLAAMIVIPLFLAGPWYVRNVLVYKNISGRLEESSGVTAESSLRSLVSIPWLKSLPFMARGAFWMGNSMFTDFSIRTMNVVLLLLVIALALYGRAVVRDRRWTDAAYLLLPIVSFGAAMIYVVGSGYVYTKGEATAASPWYLQAVMAQLLCAAMLGCQWSGRFGRYLATIYVLLWGYVLAATYLAKLIPLYGGFAGGRSTLRDVAQWYLTDWPRTSDILSTTAMVPASWLVTMLVLLLATLLWAMAVLIRAVLVHNELRA